MNLDLSNKSYKIKCKTFENDSAFKSTREFAKEYATWTPADIKVRSDELSNWAVKRWSY